MKKGSYNGLDMWSNQMDSVKRSYKGKEKEEGIRKRGRQKKRWEDNIGERTGPGFNSSQRAAEDRQRWQEIVADVNSGAPTNLVVLGHR